MGVFSHPVSFLGRCMKIISVVSLGLAAVLAFSACGDAKEAKGVPLFLSPADYDPSRLLPPPPADNSPENQMELAELHAVQQSRTPADMMRAKHDGETENATIFEETIGSGFTLAKFPATAKLMAEVQHDEKAAVATA